MGNQIKIKKRGEGFKNFLKKYGYFIAVAVIVLVVTLSVVLTGRPTSTDLNVENKDPMEVGGNALNFTLPLADCSMASLCAFLTWPSIWSSPKTIESRPDATLNRCSIAEVYFLENKYSFIPFALKNSS